MREKWRYRLIGIREFFRNLFFSIILPFLGVFCILGSGFLGFLFQILSR